MNIALRIMMMINPFIVILACNEASPPKFPDASASAVATSPMVEIADSTITHEPPLLAGTWNGIGKDRGRTFTWTVTNNQLEGNYLANEKVKEDYTKMFRFRIDNGAICCFPGNYGRWKCGTPDGTYRLTEQTDSSYTFVADRHPQNKTVSTLQFSFTGKNEMTFSRKHDYEDEDYPDYHFEGHFKKSL